MFKFLVEKKETERHGKNHMLHDLLIWRHKTEHFLTINLNAQHQSCKSAIP